MDSCVCAAMAVRETWAAALHIRYGQRTERRAREAFERICHRLGISERLAVRNESLKAIGGSALTDEDIAIPRAEGEIGTEGVPVTYVPFRNAHFLSAAVSWAEVLGATLIYIGAVEQDSSGYPDCRPAYYQAFNAVIQEGTRAGGIRIVTPLITLPQPEIARLAAHFAPPSA